VPPQVAYFVVRCLAGASVFAREANWQTGPGYRFQALAVPAGGHAGFSLLTAAETGISFSATRIEEQVSNVDSAEKPPVF
jgi:hypothetical protein